MGDLGADQAGQERIEFFAASQPLAGDLVEAGAHAVELELGHGLDDLVSLHHAAWVLVLRRAS